MEFVAPSSLPGREEKVAVQREPQQRNLCMYVQKLEDEREIESVEGVMELEMLPNLV